MWTPLTPSDYYGASVAISGKWAGLRQSPVNAVHREVEIVGYAFGSL